MTRLSLFGSTARNDAGPVSDIDLLLGAPVDLMEEGTLKPRVRAAVERDAIRAF